MGIFSLLVGKCVGQGYMISLKWDRQYTSFFNMTTDKKKRKDDNDNNGCQNNEFVMVISNGVMKNYINWKAVNLVSFMFNFMN